MHNLHSCRNTGVVDVGVVTLAFLASRNGIYTSILHGYPWSLWDRGRYKLKYSGITNVTFWGH